VCGRYSLDLEPKDLSDYYHDVPLVGYHGPSYNVAPSQYAPVVTHDGLTQMKWGLIPQWAKSDKVGYSMINAVGETIFEKATYKKAIISSRCLVPATGFYEWLETESGKQPYYFTVKDHPIFSFAGLYLTRADAEGRPLSTFTILTTTPNDIVSHVHDRMPVILAAAEEKAWIDPDMTERERIARFINPYPASEMQSVKVSKSVGNAKNNDPSLIKPIA
jgi:putative SOS response-associated peptidase YedK